MQFAAGLIIGAIAGFGVACGLACKKIKHVFKEGYIAGRIDSKKTERKRAEIRCKFCENRLKQGEERPNIRGDGDDYSEYYNKGNDCDACVNQYLRGRDGDSYGCRCQDDGEECHFVESLDEFEDQMKGE